MRSHDPWVIPYTPLRSVSHQICTSTPSRVQACLHTLSRLSLHLDECLLLYVRYQLVNFSSYSSPLVLCCTATADEREQRLLRQCAVALLMPSEPLFGAKPTPRPSRPPASPPPPPLRPAVAWGV